MAMKKFLNSATCLLAIVTVASCGIKEENEYCESSVRRYQLTLEPGAKTALSGSGSERSVSWNDGDVVMYYTARGENNSATVTIEGGEAYVNLDLGPLRDQFLNAIYGAGTISLEESSESCIVATTPVASRQSNTSFADAHVCAAFHDDITEPHIHFRNVASILQFTSFPGLQTVVFRGNNDEVINGGSFGILKITESGAEPSEASSKTVTVNTNGQSETFYVSILPTIFSNGFTIECYDSNSQLLVSKSLNRPVNAVTDSGMPKIINLGRAEDWLPKPPPDPTYEGFTVSDCSSGNKRIPYSCEENTITVSLNEISFILEDYLGIDYTVFRNKYQPEPKVTDPVVSNPSPLVLETYIKTSGSGNQKSDYKAERLNNGNVNSDFKYGTITYVPDTGYNPNKPGSGGNDYFHITLSKAQKDNLRALNGKTTTLYAHFYNDLNQHFFFGFKIYLDNDVVVNFVEHNPKYWFSDIDSNYNTVRRNVRVPMWWNRTLNTAQNDDVTLFNKLMTNDWARNTVQIIPPRYSDNIVLEWSFAPEAQQPSIRNPFGSNSRKWKVSSDGEALFYNTSYPYGTDFVHSGRTAVYDTVVKINRVTGEITYCHPRHLADGNTVPDDPDYISKALLNMFPVYSQNASEMLYCKVSLAAYIVDYYNNCRIKIGEEIINARFLRPLSLSLSADITMHDGVPGLDTVPLGRLFTLNDWNYSIYTDGFPLFKYNTEDGSCTPCYYPDGGNDIEWYGYYGIQTITVDIENIMVEQQYGQNMRFRDYCPNARFWLARKDDRFTSLSDATLDISSADKLGDYILAYHNPDGGVSGSVLLVPITIEYAWGQLTGYLRVPMI